MKWLDSLKPGVEGKIHMPECKKWINIMFSLTSLTSLESHVSYWCSMRFALYQPKIQKPPFLRGLGQLTTVGKHG